MITRRRLLALVPAALAQQILAQQSLFARKPKIKPTPPQPFVYIGTDTNKPDAKGIYLCRFDPVTGHLTNPILAAPSLRPAYLAINQVRLAGKDRRLLYSCNEGADAPTSTISSHLIDPATGALTLLNKVSSAGAGPCYISVDATGRAAFIANYAGGSIATYSVEPDGSLSQPVDRIDFHQKQLGHHGPNTLRQDAPHPHSAMLSPDNRFLIVNDLGNDDIAIFPIKPGTANLGAPHLSEHHSPGAGPRHLAFHPNARWAYGIDELSSRVDLYLWNATHGSVGVEPEARLTDAGHSVSTTDPTFHGTNTAAEVAVSPSGDFLYASNRGEDTLVVFAIDPTNGTLTLTQRIPCGGKTPRHFTFDPTAKFILCGNQDSASITTFRRDTLTGHLTGPLQTLPIESPMYTQFV